MLYLTKDDNGKIEFPISEKEVRKRLSNVSLPANLDELEHDFLAPFGFYGVEQAEPPGEPSVGKRWHLGTPKMINGKYYRTFEERDIPNHVAERLWKTVRKKRDELLTKTDWTQLSDAPLSKATKKAYADYRQALRDITKTSTDPGFVVWPVDPSEDSK